MNSFSQPLMIRKTSMFSIILKKFHIQTRYVVIATCLLAILLPILYLYQTNIVAQKGFVIRELEQQLTALQNEQFVLQQEHISLQSGPRVQERVSQLEMVEATEVNYLDSQYTDVAYVQKKTF